MPATITSTVRQTVSYATKNITSSHLCPAFGAEGTLLAVGTWGSWASAFGRQDRGREHRVAALAGLTNSTPHVAGPYHGLGGQSTCPNKPLGLLSLGALPTDTADGLMRRTHAKYLNQFQSNCQAASGQPSSSQPRVPSFLPLLPWHQAGSWSWYPQHLLNFFTFFFFLPGTDQLLGQGLSRQLVTSVRWGSGLD